MLDRPMAERWVFGGIDTTTDDAFIVEVPRRDRATLMPLLQQWIAPGKHFFKHLIFATRQFHYTRASYL